MAKRTQHVVPNNVAICCVEMLQSFGWGFRARIELSTQQSVLDIDDVLTWQIEKKCHQLWCKNGGMAHGPHFAQNINTQLFTAARKNM